MVGHVAGQFPDVALRPAENAIFTEQSGNDVKHPRL
jgi:hypothetical protein